MGYSNPKVDDLLVARRSRSQSGHPGAALQGGSIDHGRRVAGPLAVGEILSDRQSRRACGSSVWRHALGRVFERRLGKVVAKSIALTEWVLVSHVRF